MTAVATGGQESRQNPFENQNDAADRRPDLDDHERRQVQSRIPMSAATVHEAVRIEGERELQRQPIALAWSGIAAGLSMGFSLIVQSLLTAYLPVTAWQPLISSFGYSIGFLIVILGRQQLFTENTLTVILPLLTHPNSTTFARVARLWGIVLAANLVGTLIIAGTLAHFPLFSPPVEAALTTVARHAYDNDFGMTVLKGIFAGWLIALMVWLLPAAETARVQVIIILTYVVALGAFAHIIAGSVEVLFLVNHGIVSIGGYVGMFLLPTGLGNVLGGVTLVALLNFAQVVTEKSRDVQHMHSTGTCS